MTPAAELRILIVTNMYPAPGRPYFGVFVERQVEAARRRGIDVQVEVVAGDRGKADYLLARRRVARAIRSFRPELIHCHYGYTPLAAAFLGTPYIVTLCGDDLNGQSDGHGGITLKSRAGILVSQTFAATSRLVIVKSEQMRRRLWSRSRRKAELLPNGVDTDLFNPGSMAAARRRLGVPEDALVLGFVNSVRQRTKRLDLAEQVRAELRRRGVNALLLVAESVPAADMPWHYRAADCLLLTSDSEGGPNAVKESLACGTPVVGVPVGDLPELITSPAMGRVTSRDPRALADAVQSLGRADDLRPRLLPPELDADAIAARLVDLYHRAIQGARPGVPRP